MHRKQAPEDKKIRILEALSICLEEKPFAKTSIKDIARAAGVNHGLLHYYFKNKEDILSQYIAYVINQYKSLFNAWLNARPAGSMQGTLLVAEFFNFMNTRITLNKTLSKVFIEIWEIAAYQPNIRTMLQQAYREWIDTLARMLNRVINDPDTARKTSTATVAFLEGMALFSIIMTPESFDFQEVLTGFQQKIIESLKN